MASFERCFKIFINNTKVFTSDTMSENQLQQIVSQVQVVVPPIKLKGVIPSSASTRTLKRSYSTKCDNSSLILKYKNESNQTNVALNSQTVGAQQIQKKIRLRSDSVENKSESNCKKSKSDLKTSLQMSLNVNTSIDKKNKENKNICSPDLSRVIGLPNMGNTCYINSIIQVLRMTPGFRQFVCSLNKSIDSSDKNGIKLKTSNRQLISCLHKIFVNFGNNEMNGNRSTIPLTNESMITDLIECEDIKNRFELGQQQDCHEFLNWLINELNSFAELLFAHKINLKNSVKSVYNTRHKYSKPNDSMTFKSFNGVMATNITCNECKTGSSTRDSFADIQIPLCMSEEVTDYCQTQTFTEIIHKKDYLKDDNMFDCQNCSKKTNAFVFNSIETPPKVLIIFIKRSFEYNQRDTRNAKPLKKLFKAPLSLEYCSSKESINYSLYGFVMHSGADIDNGHYYAVIDSGVTQRKKYRRNGECSCALNVLTNNGWIKVNDHKVSKLNLNYLNRLLDNDCISSTPYLAFYQRID